MKQLFFSSIVLMIALQQTASAQSNTTVIAPAAPTAASANSAAASSTAEAPKTQAINIKYVGVYEGQAFSSAEDRHGKNMHGEDQSISNRPTIQYNFNSDMSAGLQTRINTAFKKEGIVASNETWRLYGTFKNVASYGIVSLDLIPRLQLPTSMKNHDKTMMVSPELLAAFNINPKNSRFSFDYTPQMLGYLYSDETVAKAHSAASFIILHNIEGTFQMSAKTQLTFGWYPEYVVSKVLPLTQDSNEVDVGVNFDIAKGWSLNPYIGVEPVGMDSNNIGKSMEAALVVNGTFL
jgi:hypothetical protein